MPDSPLVTLTVWRDAAKEPPEKRGTTYVTDLGLLYLRGISDRPEWCEYLEGEAALVKPSVYCEDPLPPGDDAIRVWHLTMLLGMAERAAADHPGAWDPDEVDEAQTRLRRALEQIGTP